MVPCAARRRLSSPIRPGPHVLSTTYGSRREVAEAFACGVILNVDGAAKNLWRFSA